MGAIRRRTARRRITGRLQIPTPPQTCPSCSIAPPRPARAATITGTPDTRAARFAHIAVRIGTRIAVTRQAVATIAVAAGIEPPAVVQD